MGYRTIKTVIAFVLAVAAAEAINLPLATFAGIAAVVGIQTTRLKTVQFSLTIFCSALISISLSSLVFLLFGFTYLSLGLIVLLLIPILVRLRFQHGIVLSIVVLAHFYGMDQITWNSLVNEVLLTVIGLGISFLMNLFYMPNVSKPINRIKGEINQTMSSIFVHLAEHLKTQDYLWDGKELLELEKLLQEGYRLAHIFGENRFQIGNNPYLPYFIRTEKQMETLQRIMYHASAVDKPVEQGVMLSQLLEATAEDVKEGGELLKWSGQLEDLHLTYQEMPLPANREEFEIRAALLQVLLEMKRFAALQQSQ